MLARYQIEWSADAALAVDGGQVTEYEVWGAVFRTMMWSRFDPSGVDPALFVRGFTVASVDSLAALAAKLQTDPMVRVPEEGGSVGLGIMALLKLLAGHARPNLTGIQLTRFAAGVEQIAVHRMERVESKLDESWPPLRGAPTLRSEVRPCSFGIRRC